MRARFSALFKELLKTQLRLKGIITEDDWELMKEEIQFDFLKNVHFAELQENEMLKTRVETLRDIDDFVGKYYSAEWIRKNVLMQTDEDIISINKQINSETGPPEGPPPEGGPPPDESQ